MDISDSPAPALSRGLMLLHHLSAHGPMTIDELCGAFAWPRSSVLRLLNTLEQHACVVVDGRPARYHALRALVPVNTPLLPHLADLQEVLQLLPGVHRRLRRYGKQPSCRTGRR